MPKLSDTMEEGRIIRWLVSPGDRVQVGDVLAEIETDKADMELEAEETGVLVEQKIAEGASASVGTVIAILDGDAAEGARGTRESSPGDPEPMASQALASEENADEKPASKVRPEPRAPKRGSGPGGRVVARDRGVAAAVRATKGPEGRKAEAASRREALPTIRQTTGRRMAESKRTIPHFYVTSEIHTAACQDLLETLEPVAPEGVSVNLTHVLLRAVTIALGEHERVNARLVDEETIEFVDEIDLGLAVALDEGLIVPVLQSCQTKDLFALSRAAREVVARAREGKLRREDLSTGTFTISNLGMYSIEEFAAVINPPHAAVLAVGSMRDRAVVRDGAVVAAPTVRVTLSCDHRIIDGAEGAAFLDTLRWIVEHPARILL